MLVTSAKIEMLITSAKTEMLITSAKKDMLITIPKTGNFGERILGEGVWPIHHRNSTKIFQKTFWIKNP